MNNNVMPSFVPKFSMVLKEIPSNYTIVSDLDDTNHQFKVVSDPPTVMSGEHEGVIKCFSEFKSKDKLTDYAKITIGVRLHFNNQDIVIELDRVFMASYYRGSELIETLDKLGVIEDAEININRLFNKKVKFVVKPNENAPADAKFKLMVTDIEPIEHLSANAAFEYVKVKTLEGAEILTTIPNAVKEKKKTFATSNITRTNLEILNEEDDPLEALNEDFD